MPKVTLIKKHRREKLISRYRRTLIFYKTLIENFKKAPHKKVTTIEDNEQRKKWDSRRTRTPVRRFIYSKTRTWYSNYLIYTRRNSRTQQIEQLHSATLKNSRIARMATTQQGTPPPQIVKETGKLEALGLAVSPFGSPCWFQPRLGTDTASGGEGAREGVALHRSDPSQDTRSQGDKGRPAPNRGTTDTNTQGTLDTTTRDTAGTTKPKHRAKEKGKPQTMRLAVSPFGSPCWFQPRLGTDTASGGEGAREGVALHRSDPGQDARSNWGDGQPNPAIKTEDTAPLRKSTPQNDWQHGRRARWDSWKEMIPRLAQYVYRTGDPTQQLFLNDIKFGMLQGRLTVLPTTENAYCIDNAAAKLEKATSLAEMSFIAIVGAAITEVGASLQPRTLEIVGSWYNRDDPKQLTHFPRPRDVISITEALHIWTLPKSQPPTKKKRRRRGHQPQQEIKNTTPMVESQEPPQPPIQPNQLVTTGSPSYTQRDPLAPREDSSGTEGDQPQPPKKAKGGAGAVDREADIQQHTIHDSPAHAASPPPVADLGQLRLTPMDERTVEERNQEYHILVTQRLNAFRVAREPVTDDETAPRTMDTTEVRQQSIEVQVPRPPQPHLYKYVPRQSQSLHDDWDRPITVTREVKHSQQHAAVSTESSVWSPDRQMERVHNMYEGIPSGPWTPLEWKDGTRWTERTLPIDAVVKQSATRLMKVRIAAWESMAITEISTATGFEEITVLARMFGVNVSISRIKHTQPSSPAQAAQQEMAQQLPFIPFTTRQRVWSAIVDKHAGLLDPRTVKMEAIRRLSSWTGDPQLLQQHVSNSDDRDYIIATALGGHRQRVHLVILNEIGADDMRWCPAWWDHGELLYSNGPWGHRQVWHAALMAMGIGLHGTTKWYKPDAFGGLQPVQKVGCENMDVSVGTLRSEVREIVREMVKSLRDQPHILCWEHRLRWHDSDLNPFGRKYWTPRLIERWASRNVQPLTETQEAPIVCSVWYAEGRGVVTPPKNWVD